MSTKPPSGTRDFLPDDIRRREFVVGAVREVYESYGFRQVQEFKVGEWPGMLLAMRLSDEAVE